MKIQLYYIHEKELTQTNDVKYLGVLINEKLSWTPHVNEVIKKSNKTLGFIKRNFNKCNRDIKLKCYLTLVRPVLEYASSVWDPSTKENIDKLEQIQKRASRFITAEYSKLTRATPLVESLNLERLEQRWPNRGSPSACGSSVFTMQLAYNLKKMLQ